MVIDPQIVAQALADVRAARPLVQCITNFVSMDLMANVLLCCGASPAMVRFLKNTRQSAVFASFTAIHDIVLS
jgi:hydroxyethylthiazole kinase